MNDSWFLLSLNPEPWAVGSISVGKKGGKAFGRMSPNTQLVAFQEAVREELSDSKPLPPGEYFLSFFFWRKREKYNTASGRQVTKNAVDTTNLQKGLEDALQGVLFDNDRTVRRIESEIVEQSTTTQSKIVIRASMYEVFNPDRIPQSVWNQIDSDSMIELWDEEELF